MNPYNNSFPEIGTCFGQILTVWPGKFVSSKKTPQNGLFLCARIWVNWRWKAPDAKPFTSGRLQWYPWNLTGMTVQMGYVKGPWHQNWAHIALILFSSFGKTSNMQKQFWKMKQHSQNTWIVFQLDQNIYKTLCLDNSLSWLISPICLFSGLRNQCVYNEQFRRHHCLYTLFFKTVRCCLLCSADKHNNLMPILMNWR